ncbi:hypothetical protein ACIPIU_37725 [Streptomyces massasporeus]|uniref:hypothetical protein n=1 Tax=Streptomyces massasporeus TaxID=67324 RepID=UPI00382E20B3
MGATVCMLSPTKELHRYNGNGTSWTKISGAVEDMGSGDWGLASRTLPGGTIYYYTGTPFEWESMGQPNGWYVVGSDTVYTKSPDAVYQFDGYAAGQPIWSQIGGTFWSIHAGPFGLFAASDIQGTLWRYTGNPMEWEYICPPPTSQLAVGEDTVYARFGNPSREIWSYDGAGTSWTKISQPMQNMMLQYGGWGLVCTYVEGNSLLRYLGTPMQWQTIGAHTPRFAVADNTVYQAPYPNYQEVYRYNGNGTSWTKIGGPSSGLVTMD